jgi:hypothetical protein
MSNPQHEPTMEEILASIRKIISEDAPEAPAVDTAAPAPIAPQPEPVHDDVLELTQEIVEPEPAPPPPQPAPPPPQPVYVAPQPAPPPPEDIVFETVAPQPSAHSDIFSDHTRQAVEDTFNAIPDEEEPAPAPRAYAAPIAPVDGATVETVFERAVRESFEPVIKQYLSDNSAAVIERMKPLIREWMDEHFPALLEGAVRAEVERVVKSRAAKR